MIQDRKITCSGKLAQDLLGEEPPFGMFGEERTVSQLLGCCYLIASDQLVCVLSGKIPVSKQETKRRRPVSPPVLSLWHGPKMTRPLMSMLE